jgi:hypothetical protein
MHATAHRLTWIGLACLGTLTLLSARSWGAENPAASQFHEVIEPILIDHCYACHGNGSKKGGVSLDEFDSDEALLAQRDLWWRVLKNVRAGIMPPAKKPRPSDEEKQLLADWIKTGVFQLDPKNPDPGRVTIRRLNRVEYRNTIRDLMGIDYKTDEEFPPDDTGYGFDTIADVLTVSPLLLEKYMHAAEAIVAEAVPTVSKVVRVKSLSGFDFRGPGGQGNGQQLPFSKEATVAYPLEIERGGDYRLRVELIIDGSFDFDPGRCRVVFRVDDQERWQEELGWADNKKVQFELKTTWQPGPHPLSFSLHPLTPAPATKRRTSVDLKLAAVRVEGPLDRPSWVHPPNYERFFFQDEPPEAPAERHHYAREVLNRFTRKAFRRPVDDHTLERLVAIAESVSSQAGKSFEEGIAQAMIAVLASPRFLFRVEESAGESVSEPFALLDEYSLASRLSYFLWSTMPDEQLWTLAERGALRKNLKPQVQRLLKDPRSEEFIKNFAGQWLELRDVDGIAINARAVLRAEGSKVTLQELDHNLRQAMRREAEAYFAHVIREDRSVAELIDSDYTFLNERLAKHYGIPDVTGGEMRRVGLPKDSPRGGLLTTAAVLVVTSNPTRTSPVKRGQFVLENILGTPAPPPPPDIPPLEDAAKAIKDHQPTQREILALHRAKPLCAACHARMDPLGLALENFNALGMWREKERDQPIDAFGQLLTGESFRDIRELKRILKDQHRLDFYRCLTEKMLTYALGRGLDYYDVETVDQIVDRLCAEEGRFSALLMGVIESAPFQKRRSPAAEPSQRSAPNG